MLHYDGVSWSPMTLPANARPISALWGTANDNVYGGSVGQILHWDGSAWTIAAYVDIQVNSISGNGPNDIYAVGPLGTMVHFDGVRWSPVRVPSSQNLLSVSATPTRVLLAQGNISCCVPSWPPTNAR